MREIFLKHNLAFSVTFKVQVLDSGQKVAILTLQFNIRRNVLMVKQFRGWSFPPSKKLLLSHDAFSQRLDIPFIEIFIIKGLKYLLFN